MWTILRQPFSIDGELIVKLPAIPTKAYNVVAALIILLPTLVMAQVSDDPFGYEFTYSVLDTDFQTAGVLQALQSEVLPAVNRAGAITYAIWQPIREDKPNVDRERRYDADLSEVYGGPFAGLAVNQLGLMLAWPTNATQAIASLEDAIRSLGGITKISSRVFVPVYLTDGLNVPTGSGFYVHREERYANENVDDAIRLSREAWRTWEPTWGVRVTGLFREVPGEPDSVNLNRIVWYPSYDVWLETRNFQQDPESARRFRARRQFLIDGSGIAIATDRIVPGQDQ